MYTHKGDANVKKFIHKFRLDKSVEYHLRVISAKGLVSVMQNYRTYGPGNDGTFWPAEHTARAALHIADFTLTDSCGQCGRR